MSQRADPINIHKTAGGLILVNAGLLYTPNKPIDIQLTFGYHFDRKTRTNFRIPTSRIIGYCFTRVDGSRWNDGWLSKMIAFKAACPCFHVQSWRDSFPALTIGPRCGLPHGICPWLWRQPVECPAVCTAQLLLRYLTKDTAQLCVLQFKGKQRE